MLMQAMALMCMEPVRNIGTIRAIKTREGGNCPANELQNKSLIKEESRGKHFIYRGHILN